jgi:hypothetical protein
MMARILTFVPVLLFSALYLFLIIYVISLLKRLVVAVEKIAQK